MYPVASSQIETRPDERRRNPRHTASAIVYVHLGPDNGGIIINLGIDGVACQAARKLSAKKNSILNVRLRGSGLDVNLVGEIIWQGASQKEIGISFKDLPASQQQVIADWIARQEQASKAPPPDDFPPPKPMPGMPEVFAPGVGYVPRAYSAAFPIPQAKPAAPPSGAAADAIIDSRPPAPVDSAGGISASTPRLEIVSPIQDRNVPSEGLAAHSQGRNADPLGSPEPSRPIKPLPVQPLSEKLSIERSHPVSAGNSPPIVSANEPIATVLKALSQASAEAAGKSELRKPEEIKPIPQDRVSRPRESLLEANAAENWIPPALLAAWRRGRLQHKVLLGSAAAVSLGFFVLILTLAVAHIGGSASNSSGSGSPQQPTAQQSTTPPPPTNVSVVPPQADPMQAPLPPPAAAPSRSHQRPQPSPFANFVKTVFGFDLGNSDASAEIDEDQLRVQVWTSKDSGYYYCTDDGYYKNVQPGTFMSQGDALQSGYRSRLGQFCD